MQQIIEYLANQKEKIIRLYQYWSKCSANHELEKIESLVYPRSGFYDLTKKFKKLDLPGHNYYYEITKLEIRGQINFKKVTAAGQIKLILPGSDYSYSGKFISTCIKKEDTWLLDDIEIEWEN